MSIAEAAAHLQVPKTELAKVCEGRAPITADMAIRLDMAFGGGPETWLALQAAYELALVRRRSGNIKVKRLASAA